MTTKNQVFPISHGKWTVAYGELAFGQSIVVYATNGDSIRPVAVTCDGESEGSVMYHESPGGDHEGIAECVANAELIAHAPAMLDIIRFLADGSSSVDSLREDAQQLLREMTGDEPTPEGFGGYGPDDDED